MGNAASVVDQIIESKLLALHTAFVGKVISVNKSCTKCTIQPLARIKAYNKAAQKQAVITNVPILRHARVKSMEIDFGTQKVVEKKIQAGDTVLCVCGERDITETIKGGFATPPQGHHNLKDAVVVGVF